MKHLVLLISALSLSAFNANSSTSMQNMCAENSKSEACQAYIAGVVDGYIISKQKYIAKQAEFNNNFLDRVYDSRVGYNRTKVAKAQPACLPDNINTSEIIAQFKGANSGQNLTIELGNYLRKQYPCD